MQEFLFIHEIPQGQDHGQELAQDRGQGGSPDTQPEGKDKDGVDDGIGNNGEQRQSHGQPGIPGRTDHGVQAKVNMGDDVAQQDDDHVIPGKGKGILTGTEKGQDGVQEGQANDGKDHAQDGIQGHFIGQHLVGDGVVFLAQQDGNHGGGAHAHKGAHGRGQVHQREGDGQAGNGQRTYFGDMADVDAVHHVVQGGCRHRNDGGNGILP